jgi:hypothetical protein
MEERSLRLARTDGTFFTKITSKISKLLIPTKVGINGMLISVKRTNVIKTYNDFKSDDEKKIANRETYEKKYENAVVLYLEALDKYIMESVYKKVKSRTATTFEEEALSRYYTVVHLKENQYLEYKYKKQQFLLELDYENIKNSNKDKVLEKYNKFYADRMTSMYKGLLKNYSIQLADRQNQNSSERDRIYNDIFENLEKYITDILPIKIQIEDENVYKEIIEDYDKFNVFLAGKLDKRDVIEKRMLLLGISRKLFTHSLPLVVAEQCYEKLLQETRKLIVISPNEKKQEMAYNMLITLIEDYNIKLLSTKIYWEKPKEREEYKKFWDKYQTLTTNEEKQILFVKSELSKARCAENKDNQLIRFYKEKLISLGVMKKIKNSYVTGTNVKLHKKRQM